MNKKRPEEYILGITERLKDDICELVSKQVLNAVQHKPATYQQIEEEVVLMTLSLAKALTALVRYTEGITIMKEGGNKD